MDSYAQTKLEKATLEGGYLWCNEKKRTIIIESNAANLAHKESEIFYQSAKDNFYEKY